MKHISSGLFIVFCAFNTFAQTFAGELDITFSNDGFDTQDLSENEAITGIVQLSDDKIVATGYTYLNDTSYCFLAKYNSDGTLDAAFGTDGIQIVDFGAYYSAPYDIAVTPDEKIVIVGYIRESGIDDGFIARFLPDGTPDNDFSDDGLLRINTAEIYELLTGVTIQLDGKIVAVGISDIGFSSYTTVVRVTTNGNLDNTFATDGIYINTIEDTYAYSVAITSDDKIIIGGRMYNSPDNKPMCFRLTEDGILDLSFSDDGYFIIYYGGEDESCVKLFGTPSGKILMCNNTDYDGTFHTKLTEINSDGSLFTGFGYYSTTTIDSISTVDMSIDPYGNFIIVGNYSHFSSDNFRIAKIFPSGIIDSTFGNNGLIATHFESLSWVNCLAIQSDGKILLGGYMGDFNVDNAISRHVMQNLVNINQSAVETSLIVFPNPVVNYFTITSSLEFDNFSLLDITGKLIEEITFTATANELSSTYRLTIPEVIQPGMYVLSAKNKNGIFATKLMIE